MIEKVTAIILREIDNQKEILTFNHPTAGRQLPAGTVEENELPESALLREIKEETGLTRIEIVKKLGENLQFTKENEFLLLKPVRFYGWPAQAARRVGPLYRRGFRVELMERKAGFIRVVYKEMDLNQNPPKILSETDGWLPGELLTHQIKRHFYLVQVLEKTADQWTKVSDMGHAFQVAWIPLEPKPVLIGEQAEWLDYLQGD